jgi:FkbM family methyltransferase
MNSDLKNILGAQSFHAIDIGGAGGLPPHWSLISGIAEISIFEPNTFSYNELVKMKQESNELNHKIINKAVSGAGGKTVLYATKNPNGSSLLPLDTESGAISTDNPELFPVTEIPIDTISLGNFVAEQKLPWIDLIKIDAQGAEFQILKGMNQALDTLLGVELEVTIRPMYREQSTFDDVHKFMSAKGYELFDIKTFQADWYIGNGMKKQIGKTIAEDMGVSTFAVAHQIHDADMLYFKSARSVLATKDQGQLRRLILLYCTYNYFGHALALVDEMVTQKIITVSEKEELMESIGNIAKQLKPKFFVKVIQLFQKAARRVKNKVDKRSLGWISYDTNSNFF